MVIAIMAILLTLLTPALQKARKQAQFVKCSTNLKALQYATVQYFLDYNKGFAYIDPVTNNYDLYLKELNEYIDNVDEARYCPSTFVSEDPAATDYIWGSSSKAWMWHWGLPDPEYGSYSLNGWLYTELDMGEENANLVNSQNKIDRVGADEIPGYGDAVWVDAWPRDTDTCPANFNLDGNPNNGGKMSMYLVNRHKDRTNLSFMDGHVQSVYLHELWSFKWHAEFETQSYMLRTDGSDIAQ